MPQSLTREADGNCVLRSDNVALRFFARNGGAPLEWWSEPFPLVTNSFPGSGVSANYELGQDPTQASANGLTENPICLYSDPATGIYNYYGRESQFDPTGNYKVTSFIPDFWGSFELADDSIAPNPDGSDTGWRTKYQPGSYAAALNTAPCPVIFQGTPVCWSGLFFVGNETMPVGGAWNQRLRNYGEGRVAFKTNISLANAAADSFAGVLFRKTIPTNNISKHEAFSANGLHLYVYRSGAWSLNKMKNYTSTCLANGQLSVDNFTKLISINGLQVEVRTNNVLQDKIEIFFDNIRATTVQAVGCNRGPHTCLFASTSSGDIFFGHRQIFHVGVQLESLYSALPGGLIVSDIKVTSLVPEPVYFYRANLPGAFLNQTTFLPGNRRCAKLVNGVWQNFTGTQTFLFSEAESVYVGNNEGTCGMCISDTVAQVDGVDNPEAHFLVGSNVINNEFVLMLNPLSAADNLTPKAIKSLRLKTTWQMHI